MCPALLPVLLSEGWRRHSRRFSYYGQFLTLPRADTPCHPSSRRCFCSARKQHIPSFRATTPGRSLPPLTFWTACGITWPGPSCRLQQDSRLLAPSSILPRGVRQCAWWLSPWRCYALQESGNWCFRWRRRNFDVVHQRNSEPDELGGKRDSADTGRSVLRDRRAEICPVCALPCRDVWRISLPDGLRPVARHGDIRFTTGLERS